jgi:uncharacterized protein
MIPTARAVVSLAAAARALAAAVALAAEPSPPPPTHYFNDYAGVVSADDAAKLDQKLRQFDEQTSSQVVVAVFPELPSPSLEDFTVRTAQAWRVGRKKLDNGAVLFVFVKDRKARIETGYGLEGALPDVTAHRILDEQLAPHFRQGDYAGGLNAAVDAMLAATRGEYTASPAPAPPRAGSGGDIGVGFFLVVAVLVLVVAMTRRGGRGRTYGRRGWYGGGPWWWGGGGGGGGGGWSGGGSGGGFSGGGFSGGGGSFGGGGASGSW